jgi:hypothetical protein
LLKPGMVLIEGGPDWFREIRMPEALSPGMPPALTAATSQPPGPPLPAPWNELEAAPRQAQGPADDPC